MKRSVFLVLMMVLMSTTAFSQYRGKLTTKSKRAKSSFESAAMAFEKYQYDLCVIHLETALKSDPKFIEAFMLLGDVYAETKQPEKALDAYKNAVAINPDFFPANFYNLANFSLRLGHYQDAMKYYQRYLTFPSLPQQHLSVIDANMEKAEFGIWAVQNPVPFNPVNLGDSINGIYDEYVNSLTPDESRIYYTLKRPKDDNTRNQRNAEEEDFYVSYRQGDSWTYAQKLPPPLNTSGNEGALCISPDGSYAIFTACYREDGFGSCDLYYTERRGERWSRPVNLGEAVNTPHWETHASIASDGKTVFFISNRPGGLGAGDIYKTVRTEEGAFTPAVNLGKPVNTEKDEATPFIHPDNQTLYFSSAGHLGLGGQDFFRTMLNPYGSWTEPVNLGYPINSYMDEVGMIINASGNLAYISSNKPGGKGRYDIYSFELPVQHRSLARVSYMKGIVYDKETNQRLQARFELIDLENGNTVIRSMSDALGGDFLVCLPEGKNYALNVQCDGYLFYSDHFEFEGLHSSLEPFVKNIPLQKIMVGETVVLRNIFFDTDKFELKKESVAELNRLIGLLKKNSSLKIEIGGHTDNVGSDEHNQILSETAPRLLLLSLPLKVSIRQGCSIKDMGKPCPLIQTILPKEERKTDVLSSR